MKKVVALILAFIFSAASVTVLSGCSGDSGTLKEIPLSDRENPVIGKVGDYEIRLDEWDFLYNSYYSQYVNMYGKEAAEQDEGKKAISDKTCAALKINGRRALGRRRIRNHTGERKGKRIRCKKARGACV